MSAKARQQIAAKDAAADNVTYQTQALLPSQSVDAEYQEPTSPDQVSSRHTH